MATLLLVDDSDDVREVLRLVAAADGRLEVVGEAVNGRDGVEAAERLQPDAIILDVAMPVMTGLEALPLLRERAPNALVVVYAGGARAEIEPAALAAGAASYFEKGESGEGRHLRHGRAARRPPRRVAPASSAAPGRPAYCKASIARSSITVPRWNSASAAP